MRPWEAVASTARPWEEGAGMNRVISIGREAGTTGPGVQPVQELNGSQRGNIATGVPCSIEIDRERGKPMGDVPGDIQSRTTWKIFIQPGDAVAATLNSTGAILTRDVLTDDIGVKYQVSQAWWHWLNGWQIRAEMLQA
jgi:hypothetical protein